MGIVNGSYYELDTYCKGLNDLFPIDYKAEHLANLEINPFYIEDMDRDSEPLKGEGWKLKYLIQVVKAMPTM